MICTAVFEFLKRRSAPLLLAVLLLGQAVWALPFSELPEEARQLILVDSESWDAPVARMRCYQRSSDADPWQQVWEPITVNLGRSGLGWGKSDLMSDDKPDGPRKREGDGRAPAGLFWILSAFGHPSTPPGYSPENLPFLILEEQQCVDDPDHALYNQVVDPKEVGGVTWRSAETMKIPLYRLGLVVGHNCPSAEAGLGSCIFFHLERSPGSPTAGCTSMSEENMAQLLLWLKTEARPVLIQLPKDLIPKVPGLF